jgi:hypothetical protein
MKVVVGNHPVGPFLNGPTGGAAYLIVAAIWLLTAVDTAAVPP